MKWNCPKCKFVWSGNMDTFHQITMHEKSHNVKASRTTDKTQENQASQKMRIDAKKPTRHLSTKSGIKKSDSKGNLTISQKRMATIKKSRY